MIFDLHCHTKEGSPDAIIPLQESIRILKGLGYDGMLVTDHDSYRGYNSLKEKPDNFIVLKGIEYDTLDAGHMIIVLPKNRDYPIFEHRGMELKDVIEIVHKLGGIIGPAHPYDISKLGLFNTKNKKNYKLFKEFDFIETFNGCSGNKNNVLSKIFAEELNKPCFGGSDSHSIINIGLAKTEIIQDIYTEDDLINLVKQGDFNTFKATGVLYTYRYERIHNIITIIGGFCWDFCTKIMSYRHKEKAEKIIQALN